MARQQRNPRGRSIEPPTGDGPAADRARRTRLDTESIPELLHHLMDDITALVRDEIGLAKAELRQTARDVTANLIKIGIAAGLAAAGGLALTTFLILALGNLMAGAFWAAALIVGVAYLAIGGLLVRRAVNNLNPQELKPDETIRSLREDKAFAKREAKEFKRDITS